jgi:hypothetical protein
MRSPHIWLSLVLLSVTLVGCKDVDGIIGRWKQDLPPPVEPAPPSAFAVAVRESCDLAKAAVEEAYTPGLTQSWHPVPGQCAARASGPRQRPSDDLVALVNAPFTSWPPVPEQSSDAPKVTTRTWRQGERTCAVVVQHDQDTPAASTYFQATVTCTVPVPADRPAPPPSP